MITFQGTAGDRVIALASEIAERYQLTSLRPLINISRALSARDELSIAVIGRFKAGKSSFLSHFLDRNLLPVGVTPVTTVVTEISFGEREKAIVHFSMDAPGKLRLVRFTIHSRKRESQSIAQ